MPHAFRCDALGQLRRRVTLRAQAVAWDDACEWQRSHAATPRSSSRDGQRRRRATRPRAPGALRPTAPKAREDSRKARGPGPCGAGSVQRHHTTAFAPSCSAAGSAPGSHGPAPCHRYAPGAARAPRFRACGALTSDLGTWSTAPAAPARAAVARCAASSAARRRSSASRPRGRPARRKLLDSISLKTSRAIL